MNKDGKRYGLIMPKKPQLSTPSATNVFGDNDDSDQDDGVDWVKKALKAEGDKHLAKKQTKLNIQKALNEDPTIYQYDEIYEDMEKTKEQAKVVEKKETKKPKYINHLLRAAERRKREQEHRIERMVQKEREAEGNEFADKESFVTSAYRAKLEEFKKMEEEEARMDRLEAIGDVTKQPDISGFYRQLYAQTVDKKDSKDDETHSEDIKSADVSKDQDDDKDNDTSLSEDSDTNSEENSGSASESEESGDEKSANNSRKMDEKIRVKSGTGSRQYRKRNIESSDSEGHPDDDEEDEEKQESGAKEDGKAERTHRSREIYEKVLSKRRNPNHGDGDGDDNNDENVSEDEKASVKKKRKLSKENKSLKNEINVDKKVDEKADSFEAPENKPNKSEMNEDKENSDEQVEENKENREKGQKKVSIWEKRTVGPVFEAALQRYYARKAMRLSGS